MRIRNAVESDAPALADAERAISSDVEGLLLASPGEIPVEAYRATIAKLHHRGLYVVAESAGALVGHLLVQPLSLRSIQHVGSLTVVVHPGNSGKGIGRRLVEYAVDWSFRSEWITKLELRVRATNTRAISLYEACGFQLEGTLQNHVRISTGYVDELCMGLDVRNKDA